MAPTEENPAVNLDVAIIGGGVAALWTAKALQEAGFGGRFALFTNSPLGEGQSLAAQGVIHGGLKYALGGKLNDASEELAAMPARWADDLPDVRVLSDHQVLWSLPSVVSKVVSFFGSKAVRGRARKVPRDNFPPVFDSPEYRGQLFRIEERVLDPVSVIENLAGPPGESLFLVDWEKENELEFENGTLLGFRDARSGISIRAQRFVFAAGAGNGSLLEQCGFSTPAMQLRPLHQVVIRKEGLPSFYSVCIGSTPKPPIVSTTHLDSQGRTVWYIGGDLAEAGGVARSESDQVATARAWFARHMSWIDLEGAEWSTVRVDRAEPKTESGARPPGAFCEKAGPNVIATWPTKLALAPNLADGVLSLLEKDGIRPSREETNLEAIPLPHPPVGNPPWWD